VAEEKPIPEPGFQDLRPAVPPSGPKSEFVQNNPPPGPKNEGQEENRPPVAVQTTFPNFGNQFQFFPLEEKDFLDSVNTELVGLTGVDAEYFVMNRVETGMDPYYNEPECEWAFTKSFKMRVFYLPDQGDPIQREPNERGLQEWYPGQITISRRIAEEVGLGAPKEGDVIRLFHPAGRGFADYDIIKTNPDPGSYWGDQGFFTQFLCEVVRRTKFIPERRFSKGNEPPGVTESDTDPEALEK
jgi:hypothetical protein